jgi:D-xylose reductase
MKFQVTPLLETGDAAAATASSFPLDTPNSRTVVDLLDRHKALLFQNANAETPTTVEEFGQFVVDLQLDYYPYIGGAAPRRIIPVQAGQNIIFTANESPPEQPIPFHHELAQTPIPPNYIFFYCDVPSQQGGETPIIDSTKVYRFAQETHPNFLAKLRDEGARYIRTLPAEDDPNSPIGRSYQNTWNVSTKEELETKLNTIEGCTYEWQPDGSVRVTTEAVPAIRLVADHAQNLVYQQTFANSIVAAYLGWIDVRNPDPREALRFGTSMDQMPEDVLQSIANFMQANRVLYTWKKGDIMALNNQLVMHSRNPFVGERKVYASIWGGPSSVVLQAQPVKGVAVGVIPPRFFEPMKPTDPLVFGFWKVPQEKCADVCYQAIQAGYRRLDCACDYGNEVQVGEGIARAIKDGLCQRKDLFVTSKLWNTYHHPDHVHLALQRTLSDLRLDYVDEYLIHFPISMEFVEFDKKYPPEWTNLDGKMVVVPNDMAATWKAMEALVDAGQTKTIGVCNFSTQLLRQLLSTCRIRPSALQVELHPQNCQSNLVRFAREAGMRVTSFSTLGASSYLELNMATNDDMLLTNTTICQLANAKNKSPAQILIRWALQRNTLPLTKTISPHRMSENRNVFDFYLTPSEMKEIDGLNQNRRFNDPGAFCEAGMGTFCPIYD